MSEAGVWAPTPGLVSEAAWRGADEALRASAGQWQAAGVAADGQDEEELDVDEELDDEDEDDEDDDDEDDDLDEFEDDELDDDDDDDGADEIDFTEDRYSRIPAKDDADG